MEIKIKRRVGTTTRLVDFYIQQLFTTYSITVSEIPYPGATKDVISKCSRYLFSRVISRLQMEHSNLFYITSGKGVVIDKVKLSITIKGDALIQSISPIDDYVTILTKY